MCLCHVKLLNKKVNFNYRHRSKIFASADRMADKMSLLRITNDEPIVNTETGKRLYFNTDINEIETVSMLPNFPFKIKCVILFSMSD